MVESKAVHPAMRVKIKADDWPAKVAAALLMQLRVANGGCRRLRHKIPCGVVGLVAQTLAVDGDSLLPGWMCCDHGDGCGHGFVG